MISLLESTDASPGPGRIRDFLETLVAAAAQRRGLVVGEAEPGRYLLVMMPLAREAMEAEINAALDLVLKRLGTRWASPHVTDFGLKELYRDAKGRWLDRHGIEALVADGRIGVVTIFCHDWLYGIVAQVAREHGLAVQTPFEEYLRTGRVRLAGTNSFQLDVFANVREMAANFDTVDHLITKVLVLAEVGKDARLAARITGRACPVCGAFVAAEAKTCAACNAPLAA